MRYAIKDYVAPVFSDLKTDDYFQYAINNKAADVMLAVLQNNGYPRCYDLADALIKYATKPKPLRLDGGIMTSKSAINY